MYVCEEAHVCGGLSPLFCDVWIFLFFTIIIIYLFFVATSVVWVGGCICACNCQHVDPRFTSACLFVCVCFFCVYLLGLFCVTAYVSVYVAVYQGRGGGEV